MSLTSGDFVGSLEAVDPELLLAGAAIGVVFGLFGAGGSAFATPVLALLGVPPVAAVASPLPAMLPAAPLGARRSARLGALDRRMVTLSIAGGLPGTIAGALASSLVDGQALLLLSGVMLLAIGARVLMPDPDGHATRSAARRDHTALVLLATFAVGVLTGLLANGGGFLLVPLFVLAFGLTTKQATGTSMLAVGILTVPTTITHWTLGHIDWPVAALFAIGLVPGSLLGARLGAVLSGDSVRRTFGIVLVLFAGWFLVHQGI
jgi:uncharacterized membrane protein YfcA